jgi:hypothetical protein
VTAPKSLRRGRSLGRWENRFLNKVLLLNAAFVRRRICLKCPSKSDSIFLPNGVATVRRSPKSFVVEVKRARKGVSSTVFGVSLHKNQADGVEDVASTSGVASAVPASPLQSPPLQASPQRRILEALVPESPAPAAEPVARRPRRAAEVAEPPPVRSAKAPAARGKKPPQAVKPPKPRKSLKSVAMEALPAPVAVVAAPAVVLLAPAPRPVLIGRAEEASRLPRGERWKRRLPKALW